MTRTENGGFVRNVKMEKVFGMRNIKNDLRSVNGNFCKCIVKANLHGHSSFNINKLEISKLEMISSKDDRGMGLLKKNLDDRVNIP